MDTVDDNQIKPLRLYRPHEAAEILGVTEGELRSVCEKADIETTLVAGSRRYWGYDLLQALGALHILHQLIEITPNRGYSAKQVAMLLGGVNVEAFQQWAVGKIPVVVMGDHVVYPGRDLLDALGANRPPLDRIEPNAVYNRIEAIQALRIGKKGFANLIDQGLLRPILIGKRRQLFLGKDLLQALQQIQENMGNEDF
ncbi:MAG: hypothetical protein JXA42_17120 [Anaerolineales bacterium]|nr:hypothetical protein [Anaerolineales bacterium]